MPFKHLMKEGIYYTDFSVFTKGNTGKNLIYQENSD